MKWFKRYFGEITMRDRIEKDIKAAEFGLYRSQKKEIEYYHTSEYYRELLDFLENYNENYKKRGGGSGVTDNTHNSS